MASTSDCVELEHAINALVETVKTKEDIMKVKLALIDMKEKLLIKQNEETINNMSYGSCYFSIYEIKCDNPNIVVAKKTIPIKTKSNTRNLRESCYRNPVKIITPTRLEKLLDTYYEHKEDPGMLSTYKHKWLNYAKFIDIENDIFCHLIHEPHTSGNWIPIDDGLNTDQYISWTTCEVYLYYCHVDVSNFADETKMYKLYNLGQIKSVGWYVIDYSEYDGRRWLCGCDDNGKQYNPDDGYCFQILCSDDDLVEVFILEEKPIPNEEEKDTKKQRTE